MAIVCSRVITFFDTFCKGFREKHLAFPKRVIWRMRVIWRVLICLSFRDQIFSTASTSPPNNTFMLSLLICRYRALSGPIQKEVRLFWRVVPKPFRLRQTNVPYRRSNTLRPFPPEFQPFRCRSSPPMPKTDQN